MKYQQSHQTVSSFLERCEKEKLTLPEVRKLRSTKRRV
jgi:hypothetical protein